MQDGANVDHVALNLMDDNIGQARDRKNASSLMSGTTGIRKRFKATGCGSNPVYHIVCRRWAIHRYKIINGLKLA